MWTAIAAPSAAIASTATIARCTMRVLMPNSSTRSAAELSHVTVGRQRRSTRTGKGSRTGLRRLETADEHRFIKARARSVYPIELVHDHSLGDRRFSTSCDRAGARALRSGSQAVAPGAARRIHRPARRRRPDRPTSGPALDDEPDAAADLRAHMAPTRRTAVDGRDRARHAWRAADRAGDARAEGRRAGPRRRLWSGQLHADVRPHGWSRASRRPGRVEDDAGARPARDRCGKRLLRPR